MPGLARWRLRVAPWSLTLCPATLAWSWWTSLSPWRPKTCLFNRGSFLLISWSNGEHCNARWWRHGERPGILGVELPVLHVEKLWPQWRAQASRPNSRPAAGCAGKMVSKTDWAPRLDKWGPPSSGARRPDLSRWRRNARILADHRNLRPSCHTSTCRAVAKETVRSPSLYWE